MATHEPRQTNPPEMGIRLGWLAWRRLQKTVRRGTGPRGEFVDAFRAAVGQLGASQDARATDLLIPLLTNSNRLQQQLAANALGELRDPAGAVPLLQLLDDESGEVCQAAFQSLARLADARIIEALLARSLHRSDQRIACEQVIVDTGLPAAQSLVRHLDSTEDDLVMRVIALLGRLPDPTLVPRLIPLLKHARPAIRSMVIQTLGQVGDRRAAEPIATLLSDPDRQVRVRAASVLGRLTSPSLMPRLLAGLEDDCNEIRERMAFALGELGRHEATPALLSHLTDPATAVRYSVIEALGKIGDPRAGKRLLELIDDPDELVRERAVGALRRQPIDTVRKRLLTLLDDRNPVVRAQAIDILAESEAGQSGKRVEKLSDRFLEMLQDERIPEVRRSLVGAVGRLKVRKAIPIIENTLRDDLDVQAEAIQSLGEIGDVAALPALLAMLKDRRAMVRYHAAQSLARLGHKNAMAPLEELLGDEDSLVRHGAARALIDLGDPRGPKLLELEKQPFRRRRLWQSLKKLRIGSEEGEVPLRKLVMAMMVVAGSVGGLGLTARLLLNAQEQAVQRGRMYSVAFSDDGKTVAVGRSVAGLIELWDVDGSRLLRREQFTAGGVGVDAVTFVPGSTRVLAFSGKFGQVFEEGKKQDAPAHADGLRFCKRTPDGKLTATCGTDGRVYLWDMDKCETVRTMRVEPRELSALAVSPDGKLVASGDVRGNIAIWEGTPAVVTGTFKVEGRVMALVFNQDATRLVVSNPKRSLTIIDRNNGSPPEVLTKEGASPPIYPHLFFLPDGQLLALESGRGDLWNLTDKVSIPIETLGGKADVAALSGDGTMVVLGDREESEVRILDLKTRQVKSLEVP